MSERYDDGGKREGLIIIAILLAIIIYVGYTPDRPSSGVPQGPVEHKCYIADTGYERC